MSAHTPGPLVPFTDKCGCTNTPAFRRCPLHAAAPALLEALEEAEIHYLPKGCDYQPRGKSCTDTPAFAPCSPCKVRATIRAAKA